jgi:hypothetical protein
MAADVGVGGIDEVHPQREYMAEDVQCVLALRRRARHAEAHGAEAHPAQFEIAADRERLRRRRHLLGSSVPPHQTR